MKTTWSLLLLAGALVLPAVARPEVSLDISAQIHLGHAVPPAPPEVVIVDAPPPGPPPWAPAHVFRRNRAYYYYPGCDVYYRPADRMWFYLEGSEWRVSVSLPSRISVDFGHSVSLTMETDRPYQYHQQVITYYPSGYFATKVKIRDRAGPKWDQRPPGHAKPDTSRKEKSRGKGHGRD